MPARAPSDTAPRLFAIAHRLVAVARPLVWRVRGLPASAGSLFPSAPDSDCGTVAWRRGVLCIGVSDCPVGRPCGHSKHGTPTLPDSVSVLGHTIGNPNWWSSPLMPKCKHVEQTSMPVKGFAVGLEQTSGRWTTRAGLWSGSHGQRSTCASAWSTGAAVWTGSVVA
jgi:hypothetical protein